MSALFQSRVSCDDGDFVDVEGHVGIKPYVMLSFDSYESYQTMDLNAAKQLVRNLEAAIAALEAAQERQP